MNKNIINVRGIKNYTLKEMTLFEYFTKIFKSIVNSYGYKKINLPVLEYKKLFHNCLGENTNLVRKEMYTFFDKKGNEIVLRPEGTSGCVKFIINNHLFNNKKANKLWYLEPMFRYERPQKGRYRQFYQAGIEYFGNKNIYAELEIIILINRIWKLLNINQYISLEINYIGSLSERKKYSNKLVNFLKNYKKYLGENLYIKIKDNPIRLLDTKNNNIKKLLKDAPNLYDYIDEKSKKRFLDFCLLLDLQKINYKINYNLVRGLNYYDGIVFEWYTKNLEEKKIAICGGGRYDNLFCTLKGPKTPAVGLAIGVERIILIMKSNLKLYVNKDKRLDIYFITIGIQAINLAVKISEKIRDFIPNLKISINYEEKKSIKKQIKYAGKNCVRLLLIIGNNEIKKNEIILKDYITKKQYRLSQNKIISKINEFFIKHE